jgi:DNA-directed RNA polymerase omega subunit
VTVAEMNRYRLVILAAQRARQLQAGVQARVNPRGHKAVKVAVEEVEQGLIDWQKKSENEIPKKEGKDK